MAVIVQFTTDCGGEFHHQHLCYIISQGFHLSDEQGYRTLIENPAFRCTRCGRAARSDTNLCVPTRL